MDEPATALTYAEARQRARLIDVLGYDVGLDVSGCDDTSGDDTSGDDTSGDETFGSVTVVRFGCREPGASSFIELMPARLRRVVLNGRDLDPGTLHGNRLPLAGLLAGNELRIEADMPYSRSGAGLHRFTDVADGETYLAVHAGLDSAQRVFAAFDQPDLKAPVAASVVAPGAWTVIGNGVARPAGGRWELAVTPPISPYLFTLVAGPYYGVTAGHRGVEFGLHARRSLAGYLDRDATEILAVTRACFDRYLEIFAEPYPFDSYDQAFVPELQAGAVENPGCVTFRDEFLFPSAVTRAERQTRAMVIAHEMAHMWFGDLVTMAWWNDVWLSESFATYMGFQVLSEATAFTGAWADFALSHKPRGYDADQRASAHPVAPTPEEVPDTDAALSGYDAISYTKGASALRQLAARIGQPAFIAGINDYLARHRFGSATLDDLLDCLSRAHGTDLGDWAARWLRSPGVDTLTVDLDGTGAGLVTHAGSRPHRVWIGVYDRAPGRADGLVLRASVPVSIGPDEAAAALPAGAADPAPALILPNDGDFSYTKVRLDPRSLGALVSGIGHLGDPLSRAVAWNAIRDLVRDGRLPAWHFLDLAVRHLPAETDSSIAGQVLGYARWTVADQYLPPAHRAAALADLARLCRELLRGPAQAGADADGIRLVAGRGLIDCASSPEDVGTLRSWLEGGSRLTAGTWPGGPGLDSRLRWQIMLRLAVLGAVGPAEVEREAGRDSTATGQQGAARCRAAIPAPDAKDAAWAEMFGRDQGPQAGGRSHYQLAATAEGFWQADQAGLVAGYVPRYFPALADLGARRQAEARVLVRSGFPNHAVTGATLRAGEDILTGAVLPGSLRRLLSDQLDDLRRALTVRSSSPPPNPRGPGGRYAVE